MHVIDAERKGDPHDHVSVCLCIGDLRIPVFHRAGRGQRAAEPPLNRLHGDGILQVVQFAEPGVFATDSAQTSGGIAFHL